VVVPEQREGALAYPCLLWFCVASQIFGQ